MKQYFDAALFDELTHIYPNVSGYLHWGANQAGSNPYERSSFQFTAKPMDFHEKLAMLLPAGDPSIIYPWGDMPCVSARSEVHRIGMRIWAT